MSIADKTLQVMLKYPITLANLLKDITITHVNLQDVLPEVH